MNENESRLREVLTKIAESATAAVDGEDSYNRHNEGDTSDQAAQKDKIRPGRATIDVVTGDPWRAPRTTRLTIRVES